MVQFISTPIRFSASFILWGLLFRAIPVPSFAQISSMQNPAITEIEQFLRHNDNSLALRRILDLASETKDAQLIREATAFSYAFRKRIALESPDLWAGAFQPGAHEMLGKLAAKLPPPANPELLLCAEGVTKTYSSGAFSLHPTNLDLYSGQVIGVVGENGNGKTTLLRCLAGQLSIDGGKVDFRETYKKDLYTTKSRVAFIPQRIPRWYGRLKDNLHFSAAISGMTGKRNDLFVDFMLERFGLTEYADLNWNQISSGYRTRFEIARIFLMQPQVLILDEPLANLDIHAQQTLLTDLRFLAKSSNSQMGILLTSQQLHEVEKAADSVMLIRLGQCIYHSNQQSLQSMGHALELETNASREDVTNCMAKLNAEVRFNGGFFTIISYQYNTQQMLQQLLQAGIAVSYCRDITSSTKRLF
jgi:ABC-2 type transport system ATP-binding protein